MDRPSIFTRKVIFCQSLLITRAEVLGKLVIRQPNVEVLNIAPSVELVFCTCIVMILCIFNWESG